MIEIRVVPDDGAPYDVTVTTRDILAWERVHKGVKFAQIQENMTMAHLYDLAHRAATRTRQYSGNLAQFEDGNDLELLEDSGSADPTRPGA